MNEAMRYSAYARTKGKATSGVLQLMMIIYISTPSSCHSYWQRVDASSETDATYACRPENFTSERDIALST